MLRQVWDVLAPEVMPGVRGQSQGFAVLDADWGAGHAGASLAPAHRLVAQLKFSLAAGLEEVRPLLVALNTETARAQKPNATYLSRNDFASVRSVTFGDEIGTLHLVGSAASLPQDHPIRERLRGEQFLEATFGGEKGCWLVLARGRSEDSLPDFFDLNEVVALTLERWQARLNHEQRLASKAGW